MTSLSSRSLIILFSLFLQAEDGIRDFHVTGVQTCALPISLQCGDFYAEVVRSNSFLPHIKSIARGFYSATQAGFHTRKVRIDAAARGVHLCAEIERDDAHMRAGEAFAGLFHAGAQAMRQARRHIVGALALLTKQVERSAKTATASQFMHATGRFEKAVTD